MFKVTAQSERPDKVLQGKEGEYLTAVPAPEQSGVDILKVLGITGCTEKTAVTKALKHIRGIKNLPGLVLPVAEVRDIFDMSDSKRHQLLSNYLYRVRQRYHNYLQGGRNSVSSGEEQAGRESLCSARCCGQQALCPYR
jgi:hypothetical protein